MAVVLKTRRFTVDEYHRMADAGIFGPEVGLLGAGLNAVALLCLCILFRERLFGHPSASFAA